MATTCTIDIGCVTYNEDGARAFGHRSKIFQSLKVFDVTSEARSVSNIPHQYLISILVMISIGNVLISLFFAGSRNSISKNQAT